MQKNIEQHAENFTNADQSHATLSKLSQFHRIYAFIESFWLQPEHRSVDSWLEHVDINNAMLATSMAPDGYLN